MIHILVRIGTFFVGSVALYFALFMYESEYGIWQSKIEDLWIHVSDRTLLVGSKTVALFNTIAEADTRILNRIYGSRLFSLRMIGISTVTSLATMLLSVLLMEWFAPLWHLARTPRDLMRDEWIVFGILIALAVPAFLTTSKYAVSLTLLPVCFCVAFLALSAIYHDSKGDWSFVVSAASLLSLGSDIAVTALIRKTIDGLRKELRMNRIFIMLSLQIVCAPVFTALPTALGWLADRPHVPHHRSHLTLVLWFLSLMNCTTLLISSAFTMSLFLVVAHRFLWPLLERLFYPIVELKVIRNRKVMGGIAVMCLAYAFHLTAGPLKAIVDAIAK